MKKLILSMAALCAFGAWADPEPKALLTDGGLTLKFVYDDETPPGDWYDVTLAETFDSSAGKHAPWYSRRDVITKVVFDGSFAAYRPSRLKLWFAEFSAVEEFVGLENLDVSQVADFSYMFSKCAKLVSLDLSYFDTREATDMTEMFSGCTALERIYAGEFFSTAKVTKSTKMFSGCTSLAAEFDMFSIGMTYAVADKFDCTYAVICCEDSPGLLTKGLSWRYTVADGQATITGCFCAHWRQDLELPAMLGGYPVTAIGKGVFGGLTGLKSVKIPSGVTVIGSEAFYRCFSLETVTIPNGVVDIGKYAFAECGLKSVKIPASVTKIGTAAFGGCPSLASMSVNKANTAVRVKDGMLCSYEGKKLVCCFGDPTSVSIPGTVKEICAGAFYGCSGLKSVKIPSGVTKIGAYAFDWCGNLRTLTIPKSVTAIKGDLSVDYTALDTVVTGIGDSARVKALCKWPKGVKFTEKLLDFATSYAPVAGKKFKLDLRVAFGADAKFTVSGTLPSGLKYGSGVISGTMPKHSSKTYEVTITAKTSAGKIKKTVSFKAKNPGFKVTVKVGANGKNPAQTVSSGATAKLTRRVKASIRITAKPGLDGVTGSKATVTVSGLPKGLKFAGGEITGTPTTKGTTTVTVKAKNKFGWSKTFKFKIEVK